MKKCRFEDFAYLYPNGMLSDGEKERFEEHLSQCEHCRALADAENDIRSAFEQAPAAAPRPGFDERILHRLQAAGKSTYDRGAAVFEEFSRKLIPVAAGFVAVTFLAAFFAAPGPEKSAAESVSAYNYSEMHLTETERTLLFDDTNVVYSAYFDNY